MGGGSAVGVEGVDRGLAEAAGCSRAVPRAAEPAHDSASYQLVVAGLVNGSPVSDFGSLDKAWGAIFTVWSGFGPHVGCPWRCQGLGLGPGLARGRQNELDCTPVQAGALFCLDPGIQGTAQGGGDLMIWGPTINLTTA